MTVALQAISPESPHYEQMVTKITIYHPVSLMKMNDETVLQTWRDEVTLMDDHRDEGCEDEMRVHCGADGPAPASGVEGREASVLLVGSPRASFLARLSALLRSYKAELSMAISMTPWGILIVMTPPVSLVIVMGLLSRTP